MPEFRRDRMTWVAYAMLAWFAYLQASPGLVVPHLRDELHMSYSSGGLHVAAFAAGSLVAGLASARAERAAGRRALFWLSALAMAAGTVCWRPTDQPTSRTSARSPVSIARTGRSWGGAIVTGHPGVLAPPGG